jgi:P-type E1-E2 ATPase
MMETDIRFFMLTGDKLETAIEIAKSCQVIQPSMKVLVLKKNRDEIFKKISKIVEKKGIDLQEKIDSLKSIESFNYVIALEG